MGMGSHTHPGTSFPPPSGVSLSQSRLMYDILDDIEINLIVHSVQSPPLAQHIENMPTPKGVK